MTPMKHSEVIDWRVWKAARVVKASGPLHLGGGTPQEGDHVYVTTLLDGTSLGDLAFVTPSPVSLALNVAIHAANDAARKRRLIHPASETHGRHLWVTAKELPTLYEFFEKSMVALSFSFQAIESFVNQLITDGLKGTLEIERRSGTVDWDAETIERNCSTEEKLVSVLPAVTTAKSPKGTELWESFVELKRLRNSTIHLKSIDQYVRGRADDQTLYYRLLTVDILKSPRTAIAVMKHFSDPGSLAWVVGAESQLEE